MFTVEQINAIHSKVKTGADFPQYVQELKALGMEYYDNYVADGHTEYYGKNGYHVTGPGKYPEQQIAEKGNKQDFAEKIKIHQNGGSDYPTICRQAAEAGVEKWRVDMNAMTCTYYDKAGNTMMVETIPQP